MTMTLPQRLSAAFKAFRFPGGPGNLHTGSPMGLRALMLASEDGQDLEELGRRLWTASPIAPFLNYARRKFPDIPPDVILEDEGTLVGTSYTGKPVRRHPMAAIVRRPNPFYGYSTLIAGTILSRIVDGNAYWFKVRNLMGEVVELWYVPHFLVEPRWDKAGAQYITHYDYTLPDAAGGRPVTVRMPVEDVVHIRHGIDPENVRKGLSDLAALWREVGLLREGTIYGAAILRNMGIPGLMIIPEEGVSISPTGATAIKERIRDQVAGKARGGTVVIPEPVKIESVGFSPEDLALDKFIAVPESRLAAAIGIPPMAIGLVSGEGQRTYANVKEAREQAVEDWLLPTARDMSDDVDFQLRGDFGLSEDERFIFNTGRLRELQVDTVARRQTLVQAVGGPYLTINEARLEEGRKPIDGSGDKLLPPKLPAQTLPDKKPENAIHDSSGD